MKTNLKKRAGGLSARLPGTRAGAGFAVASMLASLFTALAVPGAHAAEEAQDEVYVVAKRCAGNAVVRCVELRYDRTNRRARAWASTIDNGGDDANWGVAVNDIFAGGYSTADNDGWHDVSDVGTSPFLYCGGSGNIQVSFGSISRWRQGPGQTIHEQEFNELGNICW